MICEPIFDEVQNQLWISFQRMWPEIRKTFYYLSHRIGNLTTFLYHIFWTIFWTRSISLLPEICPICMLSLLSVSHVQLSIHVDIWEVLWEANFGFFLGPKVLRLHLVLQCTAKHWTLVCSRLWDSPRTICHFWRMELQWLRFIIINNKENGKKSKDSKGKKSYFSTFAIF